jgi:murein peptide amidase A
MSTTSLLPSVQLIEKRGSSSDALKILIIGGFHGEEPQGDYIINNYLKEAEFSNHSNHLYFIPCLNPWGKELGLRVNKNGVDLNRNYPTKNWIRTERDENFSGESAASEVETRVMIKLLEELKPDIILTLHAPLKCVNYDGPAQKLAEKIAQFCDYPVIADLGYPTPGSFGTYCGIEHNIPTITLEYDDQESSASVYSKTVKVFNWLRNLQDLQ